MIDFGTLIASASEIVAASSSEGDASDLGLLFLLSGFVFYGYVFLRYRNADKRHKHESETKAEKHNVLAADHHVRTITGVSNSRIQGETTGGVVKGLIGRFM